MKKLLLIAAVAVFGFTSVNAQEDNTMGYSNGDFILTGSVGFGSSSQGDFKTNTFEIMPSAGLFVSDNIAVGLAFGYVSATDEEPGLNPQTNQPTTIEIKNSTFTVGAFGRYYVSPANQFSFFGQLSAAYGSTKTEEDFIDQEFKFDGFSVELAPGLSYFVSKCVALEASIGVLGYNSVKQDAEGAEATNSFAIGLDLRDINLGVTLKF